jgi:branched-chain amino acid transport system ATP-binding protein
MLRVENLHTYYGEAHILQGVSLQVRDGEIATMIGRNGAGKTTTLRSIMGVVRPARGAIAFEGVNLAGLPPERIAQKGIAWVPEERRVFTNLTVLENLRLGQLGARRNGHAKRDLDEVFTYFPRLKERIEHEGRHLSGGEQQMLVIARALVAKPKLMLVDEPTEGLSPILVETLTEVLRRINAAGTTILLVEQTLEVALALSHAIFVMDQGCLQFSGTPAQLREDPSVQERFLTV